MFAMMFIMIESHVIMIGIMVAKRKKKLFTEVNDLRKPKVLMISSMLMLLLQAGVMHPWEFTLSLWGRILTLALNSVPFVYWHLHCTAFPSYLFAKQKPTFILTYLELEEEEMETKDPKAGEEPTSCIGGDVSNLVSTCAETQEGDLTSTFKESHAETNGILHEEEEEEEQEEEYYTPNRWSEGSFHVVAMDETNKSLQKRTRAEDLVKRRKIHSKKTN